MTEARKGMLALIACCTVWGLSPIYYKALAEVPPIEVLSHRTLWSLLFFGIVITLQGRMGEVWHLVRHRFLAVAPAAVAISLNWFGFIFSVQVGHAVEASLGYYIFPLLAVLLGVVAFGERLSLGQGIAVGCATLAVAVLTWGLGVTPWISLFLAGTFASYGVLKKRLSAGPVASVTAEVLVLAPLAAIWLFGIHTGLWSEGARAGGWFGHDWRTSALLAFSGILTGGPLILFSYASRRISLAAVGVTQYLNPTLQFFCAVAIFREPFTRWHMIAFGLIWTAVAIFSAESLRQDRAARRGAARAAASGTAVM
ncbi:MAG: EamA family transporter RarD [Paracoccaceae bacterium]|nr:EamA family transporter RarD [Paracoccaceae bacterium]MDE3121738.1 EamA family transporter RarD [Paracoccaceae bacterium]